MSEAQEFDPSKPFNVVDAPPPVVDAATQREIGLGLRLPPKTVEKLNTPLAHPTGVPLIDGFASPVSLALTAAMGAGPAARLLTGAAESLTARVGAPVAQKLLKLITPSALKKPAELIDLLSEIGKTGERAAPPAAPGASAAVAPAPPAAAPPPPAASAPPANVPPPPSAPAPSPGAPVPADPSAAAIRMGPDGLITGRPGGNPAMPDQRTLNEAALAIRRQAAQSRLAAASAPPASSAVPEAAGYVKPAPLTTVETKAFMDLMQRGMPSGEALKNVLMQRELVASLGTPTPTAAQTRFPKGMRGKATP